MGGRQGGRKGRREGGRSLKSRVEAPMSEREEAAGQPGERRACRAAFLRFPDRGSHLEKLPTGEGRTSINTQNGATKLLCVRNGGFAFMLFILFVFEGAGQRWTRVEREGGERNGHTILKRAKIRITHTRISLPDFSGEDRIWVCK